MEEISFSEIAASITRPGHRPSGNKLQVWEMPEPFVAPTFSRADDQIGGLREIVLIRASAAVGKSTIAHALSAERQIPVLDLSVTAVATGSLKGILSDLRNGVSPLDSFHAGNLPIIVDALDEGRLLSNENGFWSFLETSAETVLESRSVTDKPKLVLLGRPEAVEYAILAFSEGGIEHSVLDVGFFDKEGARELIHAYAKSSAKSDSLYLVHHEPAERLISAYFDKIESALGLSEGELWTSETGRGFAGYAPVLAAIGSLLPSIENFAEALILLNETGAQRAWSVIESVLGQIIDRDRLKLVGQLESQISESLPNEAYDAQEQLALLLQFVEGQPLNGTGRVVLTPSDLAKYESQVANWLPEHPFLKGRSFPNDVIASYVMANSIAADRPIRGRELLSALSRQPFLSRSLASLLTPDSLIDGKYLGFILNSFWSDPLTSDSAIFLYSLSDGSGVAASITSGTSTPNKTPIEFMTTTPINLFGQLKDAEVDVADEIILEGVGEAASKTFFFDGKVVVSASLLSIHATKLNLAGECWLDPDALNAAGQISLDIKKDAKFGWGPSIRDKYPFSRHVATMADPTDPLDSSKLELLLKECVRRFRTGTALTLNPDLSAPQNDLYTRWTRRHFAKEFPILVSLLVQFGLAHEEPMQASGAGKVRVRLHESMEAIRDAVLTSPPSEQFQDFSIALKKAIQ
jgi:hypothetical protein